jgi:hypothetical protein
VEGETHLDAERAISPQRPRRLAALVEQAHAVEGEVTAMAERGASPVLARRCREVGIDDRVRAPLGRDGTAVEPDRFRAQPHDSIEVVADEDDGAPVPLGDVHPSQALGLELGVTHREDLVDDEDVRLDVGRDGEGETKVHAGGVALDRCVYEPLDSSEFDDVVEAVCHRPAAHAEDGAVEKEVLASGELRVKPGADLEEGGDASPGPSDARRGFRDPSEDLEQRALARPVAPDDPEGMSFLDREADVTQRPDLLRPPAPPEPAQRGGGSLPQTCRGLVFTEAVALAHLVDLDGVANRHITSANRRSVRWK